MAFDWYYRFEIKGIQEFILSSQDLKQVLGASALIKSLTRKVLKEHLGEAGSVIYQAAGGATLGFNDVDALKDFAARWPMVLAREAPGATCVQAWAKAQDGVDLLGMLAARIARARNAVSPALPTTTPVMELAKGGAPAAAKPKEGGFLSAGDRVKLNNSQQREELVRDFVGEEWEEDERPAASANLSEIAGGRYLAFIHIDGNSIGRLVKRFEHPQKMAAFAKALGEVTEKAAREAAGMTLLEGAGSDARLLARPIVIGGDDVSIIARADRAMDFVTTYCKAFERLTGESTVLTDIAGGKLTASAGVAYVRATHPFLHGNRLAEKLCGRAKKASTDDPPVAMVAFERLSASLDLPEDAAASSAMTMGPYRVTTETDEHFASLTNLRDLSQALRKLPVGPVREMLRDMEEGDHGAAQAHWKRLSQVQSLGSQKARDNWDEMKRALGKLAPGLETKLWIDRVRPLSGDDDSDATDTRKRTPWLDAHIIRNMEKPNAREN